VATRFARLRRPRDRHGPMVATRFARLRRPRDRHGYQVFQWVRLAAGNRLAGRKSVPLV
jgi:hypothetical protein